MFGLVATAEPGLVVTKGIDRTDVGLVRLATDRTNIGLVGATVTDRTVFHLHLHLCPSSSESVAFVVSGVDSRVCRASISCATLSHTAIRPPIGN